MPTENLWKSYNGKGFDAKHSDYAERSTSDENGNVITATYALKTSVPTFTKSTYRIPDEYESVLIGGRKYKTVTIGNQQWMAENLDYAWDGLTVGHNSRIESEAASYYNNQPEVYGLDGTYKCGLLYNGMAVKYLNDNRNTLLPDGWHLPTQTEFNTLFTAIGGITGTAAKLKAKQNSITSSWPSSEWGGTDEYGFNVLPSGCLNSDSFSPNINFNDFNSRVFFWTASVSSSGLRYAFDIRLENNSIYDSSWYNYMEFSVRLVKNIATGA